MDARTALRRGAARAIAQPNFDRNGIPGIDDLERELRAEYPEIFAEYALPVDDDDSR